MRKKEPSSGQGDQADRRNFGCLKLFLTMCLFGVTSVLVGVFVIDKLNLGGKVKGAIRDILRPEPEIRVVEKVVEVEVEKIVEKIVEVEVKPPMPSGYIPWQKVDTAKLWSGIRIENRIEAPPGNLASVERERDDGFQLEMKLAFKTPRASQSMAELQRINPELPRALPGLASMVDAGEVSDFFHNLYQIKTERIQQSATRLDKILSVHNLYDTETVLEIENGETGQKVLLIQSDMDVVSDGSDGDRWPFLDNYISMSQFYQPFTSYGWRKRTANPNPLLARWEEELKERQDRFAIEGLSIEENRFLRSRISQLEREISDLKARSYLIAEADPFIVMSLSFLGRRDETEFGPMIGDYAVVVHEDKLFPAIVGDAGPTFKFGEASLRMARAINEKASPYNRPVSDLGVTYLVFPNSREEVNTPPDLDTWWEKCMEYLNRIGGIGDGYELHRWEDLIPVKLEEWKRRNDPATLLTDSDNGGNDGGASEEATAGARAEPGLIDPASMPQPSFSAPVTSRAAEEGNGGEGDSSQ